MTETQEIYWTENRTQKYAEDELPHLMRNHFRGHKGFIINHALRTTSWMRTVREVCSILGADVPAVIIIPFPGQQLCIKNCGYKPEYNALVIQLRGITGISDMQEIPPAYRAAVGHEIGHGINDEKAGLRQFFYSALGGSSAGVAGWFAFSPILSTLMDPTQPEKQRSSAMLGALITAIIGGVKGLQVARHRDEFDADECAVKACGYDPSPLIDYFITKYPDPEDRKKGGDFSHPSIAKRIKHMQNYAAKRER